MKRWKRVLTGVLAAAVLAAGFPYGVQASVSEGFAASGESDALENAVAAEPVTAAEGAEPLAALDVQEPVRITEFVVLQESQIKIRSKIAVERLTERMPETLTAIAGEEGGPVEIPVEWKCAGNYEESNYFYYQFDPVWDDEQYVISEEAVVPYIAVFIGMEEGLKLSSSQENRETIYDFMRTEMGFSVAAVCGVLANIHAESSFNPTAATTDTNGLTSYGLCQWNGSRFTDLQNYCSGNNLDYRTVEGQLRFLKYELEHSEASACAKVKGVEDSEEGAYMAGYNWARYFERCSSVYFETRANLAKDVYWPIYGKGADRKKYKITYHLDGGKNNSENPSVYYSTSGEISFKNPTRKGYIFQGWYTSSSLKTQIRSISGSTGKNVKIYAKWKAVHYTIRFSGNGAESGWMGDISNCEYDCFYTLSPNQFKKSGCKFLGWNTKADGKGKSYTNKEYVQNLAAKDGQIVVLYAQWKKQAYKIKYNLNGGKNNEKNPKNYTVSTDTIQLKSPTRTGYTFEGWYSDKKCQNRIFCIPRGSTGAVTLYAKWKLNTYKVVFNGNQSTSGTMNHVLSCKYGKSYILSANKFKRTGYTFTGWNTKKDGSGQSVGNKGKIKNLTTKNNTTVTLYAQWQKISYTIDYVLDGGVMILDNPTKYYADTKTFRLNDPEREGYTFQGWYTESSFKNKITKVAKGTKKNLTLYAKWSVNHYTVRFDGNDADEGAMEELACQYDKQYTLFANSYQKDGCQFIGWNTKADGSGIFYKDEASVRNLTAEDGAEVLLFAQWEELPK